MLDLKLDIDSVALAREISDIQRKQIPFALVLAQTRLATNRIKPGILKVMGQRLDRPTPTTMRSLFAQAATKSRPAKVWFKDSWTTGIPADTYLKQSVQGGPRPHKRFEKSLIAQGLMRSGQYAVPTIDYLNQYGNVSRGTMTRILSGLGAAESGRGHQANATGSKRSQRKGNAERYFVGALGDESGVWERKKSAFGDGAKPVFLFTDSAPSTASFSRSTRSARTSARRTARPSWPARCGTRSCQRSDPAPGRQTLPPPLSMGPPGPTGGRG